MGYGFIRFGLQPSDSIGLTEAQRLSIELQIVISITFESTWLYRNFKHPRYENFYGYAQIMSGAFVVQDIPLRFLNQELLHWQQGDTDILQSIGCATKKILLALTPPSSAQVDLYLLRQRYTGIRIRLLAGVEANLAISWHFAEQLCDENIIAPPANQGNPPAPDNANGAPGSGRGSQPNDPKDPSNNDGNANPADGRPNPPSATGVPSRPGQWYQIYSGYNGGCNGTYSSRRAALDGATDGFTSPIFVRQGQGDCGPGSSYGEIRYKGMVLDRPADVTSITFDFVPS